VPVADLVNLDLEFCLIGVTHCPVISQREQAKRDFPLPSVSTWRESKVIVTFAWRFVLMQGPMWSLFDIRDIIRSYDQEVRAIVWKLSCEFMPPFGETPTPLDDSIDI